MAQKLDALVHFSVCVEDYGQPKVLSERGGPLLDSRFQSRQEVHRGARETQLPSPFAFAVRFARSSLSVYMRDS